MSVYREKQLQQAINQIDLLNRTIEQLKVRFRRAKVNGQRAFRYTLRTRLCTLEGVRCVYYLYAEQKAKMLDEINEQLQQLHVNILEDELFLLDLEGETDESGHMEEERLELVVEEV